VCHVVLEPTTAPCSANSPSTPPATTSLAVSPPPGLAVHDALRQVSR
jgi:hypothetical protein